MKKPYSMNPALRDAWLQGRTKHGAYANGGETPEHYIWRSMIARCTNPKQQSYKYYGGAGVQVCERWHDFEHFLQDMGTRPSVEHSLERIDVYDGYAPHNCKWATRSEQQKNKTSTRWYTDGIFIGTLVECAAHVGIGKELAHWRWKHWGTFVKGITWHELQKRL